MVTDPETHLLNRVREVSRPEADARLRRRMVDALNAGVSEVKVAKAAGISRTTLRAWTHARWIVHWRGEEVPVEGRRFPYRAVAESLTDLPVSMAGPEGVDADDLEPGESTMLAIEISRLGEPRQTLRYRVTRDA